MTTIKIVYKTNEALVEVSGHANYAEHGSDIVCAAISTACIFTANLIDKLDMRYNILDLVCEEGYFRLQIKTDNNVILSVFENLAETLDSLQQQYPKYIKLKN